MKRSTRKRRPGAAAWVFPLALLAVAAYAVHDDGFFELGDGATATPGSADILGDGLIAGGPDWDDLFETINGSPGDPNGRIVQTISGVEALFPGGVRAVFLADDLSQSGLTDDTIFVGSNKNNDLVSTWRWGSGNNPPKNDVSNAYAYAVQSASNDLIIYAGIERLAPNGANHLDFEFNQATISLDNDPPCPTSECEFIGEKTDGDLLVNMDFDQGGNISSVALRQWDEASQQFVLIFQQTPAPGESDAEGCNDPGSGVPGDVLCAFSNNAPIDGGNWPNYQSPGASLVTDLPAKAFTEIGINVTAILGDTPCLGTIQAKTRSSPSFNSELKDFALGNFDLCGLDVVKACTDAEGEGGAINFSGNVENTGIAALDDVQVFDSQLNGTVELFDNEACTGTALGTSITLGPGESAYYCDSYVPSVSPSQNDVLATGTNGGVVFSAEDSAECVINTTPGIQVTKACTDATTPDGDIGFTGSVSNTGNVTLNDVTVFDDQVAADLALFDNPGCEGTALGMTTTLGLAGTAFFCGSYSPTALPSTNTVDAEGTDAINGGVVTDQDSAECTAPARLTLVKEVTNDDGGTAQVSDWTLTADCANDPDDFSGTTGVNNIIQPGTCSLSESGPANYTAGDWSCDGGSLSGADITLAAGDDVTCTIVNDDDPPMLKLVKNVTNDDGGLAGPNDWTLSATAAVPDDGRNFSNAGGSGIFENVFAGATYALSESLVAGYTAGNWVCDGGTQDGANITLGLGEEVTCTIVNDDIPPELKLVKLVTNDDGGTAVDDDWTLTAVSTAGRNISTPGGSGVFETVFANASYGLAESGPAGYTASAWVCTGGGTQTGASITLGLGEQATCTITNDDDPPSLKLVKVVVNDDGGLAVADDWTLSANAAAPDDGRNFSNAGGSGGFMTVFANASYALAESAVAGYTADNWSCDGGNQSGANITLGLGDQVTCTIVNDDIPPELKLVKLVTNDDGGTAIADDWTLTANFAGDGSRDISTAGGSGVFETVFANASYALAESFVAGYAADDWSCDGGSQSGANITLGLGDQVTCTIVNDDIAPRLRVLKILIPSDDPGQFNLRIDGTTFATGGDGADTGFQEVLANVQHTVDETAEGATVLTDYVISIGGDCAADGTITLGLDEDATCTITNVKKGMVEIVKLTAGIVDPTFEWSFQLDGPTPGSPFFDSTASDPLNFGGLKLIPDESNEYTLCEVDIPSGWTSVWSFNGNPVVPFNPDLPEDLGTRCFSFLVGPGDNHQFTIDNIPPPGGDARTIGYWRNWSSCSGGRQFEKAEAAGFGAGGFWIIDEVLPQFLGLFEVTNCDDAVNLISKRTINGDNSANDAAYSMAAQLLAAKANLFAGAGFCGALTDAVSDADALLVDIVFDGQGEFLTPRAARGGLRPVRMEALDLAAILDSYNNNTLCP